MGDKNEIKHEMLDPAAADIIGGAVIDELKSRNYDDLAEALKGVPCAVLKLEGVPTVSAVALIGFNSPDITDITHTETEGDITIKFKTPDDNPNTYHQLIISRNPNGQMFFSDGWGSIAAVMGQVTGPKGLEPGTTLASMLEETRNSLRLQKNLNNFFACSNCVMVGFSSNVKQDLYAKNIGYPAQTFALVRAATQL